MTQIDAIDAVYGIWGVDRPRRLEKLASADPPLVGWRKRI
jgi:hypothetical protein